METDRFASGRVVDLLRARILSGELAPGARIRQDDIAAEIGSSRLPVREALQILRHQGLVELRPNAGARVMAYDPAECDLVYRVRERVEPIVLAESAPRLTPETLDEMEAIQQRIEAERDLSSFLELDRRFHQLSYSACPMTSMIEMVDRFWDTTQHYRRTYSRLMGEDGWDAVDAEHRLILSALRDGEAAMAAHVLEGHIRRSRLRLASHPEAFTPDATTAPRPR